MSDPMIPSECIRFLWLMIDPYLNYELQIIVLQEKLNTACALLRCLKDAVPLDILKMYYLTCVQPIIAYGIMFWGSSLKAVNIFKCQKRILRCIFRLSPRTSCRDYSVHNKILTITSLYFLKLVVCIFSLLMRILMKT